MTSGDVIFSYELSLQEQVLKKFHLMETEWSRASLEGGGGLLVFLLCIRGESLMLFFNKQFCCIADINLIFSLTVE